MPYCSKAQLFGSQKWRWLNTSIMGMLYNNVIKEAQHLQSIDSLYIYFTSMKLWEIKRKLSLNMVPWQPVAKQQDKPHNILLAIKKTLLSCRAFTWIHLLHSYKGTHLVQFTLCLYKTEFMKPFSKNVLTIFDFPLVAGCSKHHKIITVWTWPGWNPLKLLNTFSVLQTLCKWGWAGTIA